jgi:hypothetical protein
MGYKGHRENYVSPAKQRNLLRYFLRQFLLFASGILYLFSFNPLAARMTVKDILSKMYRHFHANQIFVLLYLKLHLSFPSFFHSTCNEALLEIGPKN